MKESTQKESAYSSSKNPRTMWQKMIKRWRKCECCYSTIFFCGWRLQRCLHFRSSSRVMPTSFWSELTHSPYLVRWKKMQKWKKRKEKERNMRSLRENRELDCTQQNKLTESFKRFVYRGGECLKYVFDLCRVQFGSKAIKSGLENVFRPYKNGKWYAEECMSCNLSDSSWARIPAREAVQFRFWAFFVRSAALALAACGNWKARSYFFSFRTLTEEKATKYLMNY